MGKDQEFLEAARNGNIVLFEKILNQKSKRGGPLASLRRGPGINVQDSVGYSALHYSALNGHTEIVRLLLFHDASPNLLDSRGSSALHLAAWAGHQEIVKMLLTHPYKPANPDMQTMENETPLHCAAQHGHTGALTTLLAHGADPNVRNNRNETPLDLAAQYGRLQAVQMLIRAHPELLQPYSVDLDSSSSMSSATGGAASIVVNHSALHLASRNGHNNVVEILLAAGVNVNLLTPSGTALHEAALCGKDLVVRTLLEAGADLNATDSENRTPLDVLQEFPPHVTKSIISVINSFRRHDSDGELYERYVSEENDEASSTRVLSSNNFSDDVPKENHSRFQNHAASIGTFVLTDNYKQSNLSQQAQASLNGELADFYVKMEPIKVQKAAPKKPPRRNLSISPTHLQNFFINNELIRHNMEFGGNIAENTLPASSLENSLQNQGSYEYDICTASSGSAIYSSNENLINSNSTTCETNNSWYPSETANGGPISDFKSSIPRKSKTSYPSYGNATLKSYNPNRKLKRNREQYFAKGQFSLAISSNNKQQHLPESHKTPNPTSGKNENIGSRRPLSQEHKFPPDYLQQNFFDEAGISPQDNHPLSLCNSSGSISSGVSPSDRSLSTDCVEEYVGDEPFAGLFKGSTMNLSNACSNNIPKVYYISNEYHNKSSAMRSRRDIEETYKHTASSTTDSHSESSDEASVTIMNDKVNNRNSRTKRDKRLGSDRRNKVKESHNIRKIRPFLSCENNAQKLSANSVMKSEWKKDCPSPPAVAAAAAAAPSKANLSIKKQSSSLDTKPPPLVSGQSSKILNSYNENEAWDKLSQIMETFGNSTFNGLNSFLDHDDVNRGGEYGKFAKLLDQSGLGHLERSLYINGYDNYRFLNGIIDEKDLSVIKIFGEDSQKLLRLIDTLPNAHFTPLPIDASLDQWLKSIQLSEYNEHFKKHLYNSLKSVCGVWEIELQTVLEINKIGHRKRILHSVAQIRQAGDVKNSCDNIANKTCTAKENNPKGTLGHNKKNRPAPKPPIKSLEIRAPSELLIGLPHNLQIKWPHLTSSLISNSLKYEVCYLGSTVVKELRGTETTRKSIQKLKRVGQMTHLNGSKESIVQLSISHRGVEFIDVAKSETICEHEIRNINCACQDADDMRHFAYITKDNGLNLHYCHVFNVDNMHLAMEIILTLAESFEVAYQLALRNTPIRKSAEHLTTAN